MRRKFLVSFLLAVLVACFFVQFYKPTQAQTSYLKSFEKDGTYLKIPMISIVDASVSYRDSRDSYQFNITLEKPLPSNILSIPIETSGLDFYYQPPLDQELKVDGAKYDFVNATHGMFKGEVITYRPENVVDSYAVYKTVAKSGETGKLYHIYRPLIIDAKGVTSWAKLDISKTSLNIVMDEKFLANAVYPIVVDPSFGFTGIGGSNDYDTTSYTHCCKFTATESGTVTNIGIYMRGVSGTINVKAAIWNAAASGALLGQSGVVSVTTTAQWWNFTISATITAGTAYWLGEISSGNHRYYYDAGAANQWLAQWTVTYPTFPDPWDAASETYAARKMSIYANYTVAGGTSLFYYSQMTLTLSLNRGSIWSFTHESAFTLIETLNSLKTFAVTKGSVFPLALGLSDLRSWSFGHGATLPLTLGLSKLLSWSFNRYATLPLSLSFNGVFSRVIFSRNLFFYSMMGLGLGFWTNGMPLPLTALLEETANEWFIIGGLLGSIIAFCVAFSLFARRRKKS
jgi:hypothetical protein